MKWQVWVDTGGTFTDCIGVSPVGEVRRAKVLSSGIIRARLLDTGLIDRFGTLPCDFFRGWTASCGAQKSRVVASTPDGRGTRLELESSLGFDAPELLELRDGSGPAITAARLALGVRDLPPLDLRVSTTIATNALLERRVGRVAFVVTRGFADLLVIGDQTRPRLFDLDIPARVTLCERVVEIDARVASDGAILTPLQPDALDASLREARASGCDAVCICLLHASRHPAMEIEVEAIARRVGFEDITRSSEVAPRPGYLARARTSVANAAVSSRVSAYLREIRPHVEGDVDVMTSAGGLSSRVHPKDTLLSGPAGGVIGARRAGARLGHDRIISFDMGGTSTDVTRCDSRTPLRFSLRAGDAEILSPAIAIETVASGGGSICTIDRGEVRVGPESAGADPGPASYGRGGPCTLTDANLVLGRLQPDHFRIPVDPDASEKALRELGASRPDLAPAELAEAFVALADERMADAIRRISIREGYDPSEYAMVAFGGAGGLHACGVAARLDIRTVVFPRDAGLLSALGVGQAPLESIVERQVAGADLEGLIASMEHDAMASLHDRGDPVIADRIASVRLGGQSHALDVTFTTPGEIEGRFVEAYRARFGYRPVGGRPVVDAIRVVAHVRASEFAPSSVPSTRGATRPIDVHDGGAWVRTEAIDRETLEDGRVLDGPLVVLESHGALFLPGGWRAEVKDGGAIEAIATATARSSAPESILGELFANRLMTIATEMGEMLEHVAMSANVRERRDFSCAVLDASGRLIANAPHVPVHLGSMGVCVRAVMDAIPIEPGDVVVTNHPAFGGSHLPDVTVITPVDVEGTRLGYVASRAHHAEIGGVHPGSMPPMAGRLEEEGVIIPPTRLGVGGVSREEDVRRLLTTSRWPTRSIDENMADLQAQVAANALGAETLASFAAGRVEDVRCAMDMLYDRAASRASEALRRLGEIEREAIEHLDDGTPLRVRVSVADGRATFDFRGSGAVHACGLNATPAIVRSTVAYIMRLLVGEDLPLNEGLLHVVEIVLETGMLSPDFSTEAPGVAGGNVETSQRLVDAMIRALDLGACSQGTMNNVVFGNDRFGFYETICGGAGATPHGPGASAVHTHMTNTRITDAEVLESRYPVRLESFEVRRGSGGSGVHPGGDGVRRRLRMLEDVRLCVLTQHRTAGPFGRGEAAPGASGVQWIERADGTREVLPPIGETEVRRGDVLVIETPGGGGWSP